MVCCWVHSSIATTNEWINLPELHCQFSSHPAASFYTFKLVIYPLVLSFFFFFFCQRIHRLISQILKVASIYPLNAFGLWEESGDSTHTQGDLMLMVWRCSKASSVVTLMRHCSFRRLALMSRLSLLSVTHSSAGIHMLSSLTHIVGRLSTFMSVDPRINPLLFRNGSGDYIFGNFTDKLVLHINQCWSCLSLAEPGLCWNVKMKATIFQLSMTNSKIKWIKHVFHIHSSGVTQRDEHTLDWLPPQPLTLRMEDDLFKGSWCPSRSVTSTHSL